MDRIFTRVGASDFITRGQSTFMVEMNETANILNNATDRSLIVLDEIGRGTSTFDGISIAWAVAEYIHTKLRARTLFATHYHELTELALTMDRVKNYTVAIKEWNDQIIFLRKVVEGGADKSYGIQVARLAGLPAGGDRAGQGSAGEPRAGRVQRTGPAGGGVHIRTDRGTGEARERTEQTPEPEDIAAAARPVRDRSRAPLQGDRGPEPRCHDAAGCDEQTARAEEKGGEGH